MTGTDAVKPVGIYARVSTVEQIEGTSLVLQIDRCRQYAAAMGWQVAGEYVDEGVSGAKASRPALDEMMGDARAGLLQAVVAAKLDRVGRSMRHLVSLMGECDDLGVAVVSVAEGFDSTTPAGRLQRNILGSFAEFERDQIRERTMGGSEAAAGQGRWVGGPPPFGYRLAGAGRDARLEIDPVGERAVRRISELFVAERQSSAAIAKVLEREGLRPRHARRWTGGLVRGFLREAIALSGTWTYRRPGRNARSAPIEMTVPAILSPAEHAALRARVEATATIRRRTNQYVLSGRISSPCGATMQGTTNTAGNRLYRCANSFWHAEHRCDCRSVRAETVERAVLAAVQSALGGQEQTRRLAQAARRGGATAKVSTEDLAAVERRVKRLERAAGDSLARALAAGVDPLVASQAAASLAVELAAARTQRDQVAGWVAVNAADARRARDIDLLAEQIDWVLESPDAPTARRLIELLAIHVTVSGWQPCPTCAGKGLLPVKEPGETQHTPGRVARVCDDCQRHRHIPVIAVRGVLPLADTLAFNVESDSRSRQGARRNRSSNVPALKPRTKPPKDKSQQEPHPVRRTQRSRAT